MVCLEMYLDFRAVKDPETGKMAVSSCGCGSRTNCGSRMYG